MVKKRKSYTPGLEDAERTLELLRKRRAKEKRDAFLKEMYGKEGKQDEENNG